MSKEYYTTIGLEIHAELNTNSKMFCGCVNNPDEEKPNTNVCPVCLAHPGTLPVINKKAVESVIKVGLALGANIADFTEFDRKNYFYPDIPKAYQISQYKYPIVSGGELNGVKITRVHLEEDTANNKHDRGDYSLVDFNRSGVPLMELVTEPVIHSAKEAGDFGKELQLLLRTLGVSEANMEKGQMRVELNISISEDPNKFGTKCEVKNINSFKAVEKAALCEIKRMTELLGSGRGNEIVQETRGWNEDKQTTFSQRSKENANDYRYFPDPDIPKLFLSKAFDLKALKEGLPELPQAKRDRYKNEYGIKDEDIEIYLNDSVLGLWFEEISKILKDQAKVKIASNYIVSDFLGLQKTNENVKIPKAENFAELISMLHEGQISSRVGKDILAIIAVDDNSPLKIATEKDLIQKNDEGALKEIAQKVIDANPIVVATYKGGKENALMSLVGQIMKETKGSANPALVQKVLKELLS
jgi:aspartyl-tRNA(Asn)/glutamyl-tRNA(Gln) amidotransferase subunit B